LKILHVIPSVSPRRGGPTEVVLNLVRHLNNLGVEAEIATTNDHGSDWHDVLPVPLGERVMYEGAPTWFLPRFAIGQPETLTDSTRNANPSLNSDPNADASATLNADLNKTAPASARSCKAFVFSAKLSRWLWQNLRNYDVLDHHYLFSYPSTCAGAIARWQRIPYTVRAMGQLSPWTLAQSKLRKQVYSWLIERHNLNRAAAVHCTSAGEVDDVRNFGIQAPTLTLPLGVNAPADLPDAPTKLRHVYDIDPDVPVILFLSRLHYKKRPDLLLRALGQLKQQGYRFHLILAGEGEPEYQAYLAGMVGSLDLNDRVTLPGLVTGTAKDLLLRGADFFVLPSFSENFGIAVAEAMIAGLAVIVTPDVQIAPEVANAQAGLVVPGEVEAWVRAIAQLLDAPDRCRSLGLAGQHYASNRYTWQTIAEQLAQAYTAIAQGKPLPKERKG